MKQMLNSGIFTNYNTYNFINLANKNKKVKGLTSVAWPQDYQQSFLWRAIRDTRTCRTLFFGVVTGSSSSLLSWLSLVLLTARERPFFLLFFTCGDWWLLEWCLLLCSETVLLLLWWWSSSESDPDSKLLRFRFLELCFSMAGSNLGASGKTL